MWLPRVSRLVVFVLPLFLATPAVSGVVWLHASAQVTPSCVHDKDHDMFIFQMYAGASIESDVAALVTYELDVEARAGPNSDSDSNSGTNEFFAPGHVEGASVSPRVEWSDRDEKQYDGDGTATVIGHGVGLHASNPSDFAALGVTLQKHPCGSASADGVIESVEDVCEDRPDLCELGVLEECLDGGSPCALAQDCLDGERPCGVIQDCLSGETPCDPQDPCAGFMKGTCDLLLACIEGSDDCPIDPRWVDLPDCADPEWEWLCELQ